MTEAALGVDEEEVDSGSAYELLKSGLVCLDDDDEDKALRYFEMAHDMAAICNLPTAWGKDAR